MKRVLNRRRICTNGFTLIEMLVALCLLSLVALGLTTTLMSARRNHAVIERWSQATLLAAEGLEQLRAGRRLQGLRIAGDFDRSAALKPWAGRADLLEAEVTVSWIDQGETYSMRLTTLIKR